MATPLKEAKIITENKALEQFILKPFQTGEYSPEYDYTRMHNGLPLTLHYRGIPIPRAPIFHPYSMTDSAVKENGPLGPITGVPATTITLQIAKEFFDFLPLDLKNTLTKLKVDKNKLDMFFVTQNIPWTVKQDDFLIRPHYWVHGLPTFDKAITAGVFNQSAKCQVGIYSKKPTIQIDKTINIISPVPILANSHAFDSKKASEVVCSPCSVKIVKGNGAGLLSGIQFNGTQSFYSVVTTGDGRVAVTLHWLVSPKAQKELSVISKTAKNLRDIMVDIEKLGTKSELCTEQGPLSDLKSLFNVSNLRLSKASNPSLTPTVLDKNPNAGNHFTNLGTHSTPSKSDPKRNEFETNEELQMRLALAESLLEATHDTKTNVEAFELDSIISGFQDLTSRFSHMKNQMTELSEHFFRVDNIGKGTALFEKIDELDRLSQKMNAELNWVLELRKAFKTVTDPKTVLENMRKGLDDFQAQATQVNQYIQLQNTELEAAFIKDSHPKFSGSVKP